MKPLVPQNAVLCSDGASDYAKVAAQRGIEHFVVGSKPGTRVTAGSHHIQNVNSLHARCDRFIRPFCGPATKNLNDYIWWLEVRLAGMAASSPTDRVKGGVLRSRGISWSGKSGPTPPLAAHFDTALQRHQNGHSSPATLSRIVKRCTGRKNVSARELEESMTPFASDAIYQQSWLRDDGPLPKCQPVLDVEYWLPSLPRPRFASTPRSFN